MILDALAGPAAPSTHKNAQSNTLRRFLSWPIGTGCFARGYSRSRLCQQPLVLAALRPAAADRVQRGVHLALERHVCRVVAIERVEAGALPHHVGRHAGALHSDAVHLPGPRPALLVRRPARVRVAPDVRVPREEAVAEHPRRPVRDERVLAEPAGAVGRVVRVQVEEAPVLVGRVPEVGRPEAANADALVGVLAEDRLEAAAVDPVGVDVELGEIPGPVREMQPPGPLPGKPGSETQVRQGRLPALKRPVGAVRRFATRDEPGELGAVVGLAGVLEGLPDELAVLPAAGVVELEMDLANLSRGGAASRVG